MRVVVTGHSGQVARCVAQVANDQLDLDIVFLHRPDFDLLETSSVEDQICQHSPDIVVSAAAYTAVDLAEDEENLAFAINAVGAGAVAAAAKKCDAPIIHISTDYVFDGTKEGEYSETDVPNPQTAYGRTKLAGESFVASANPEHIILRTAWIFSAFGQNFVKTMLRIAKEKNEVGVVNDQFGNPTSAYEIAKAIIAVAKLIVEPEFDSFGVYHFAGPETMSWADFAKVVFEQSAAQGGPICSVTEIDTSQFPSRAVRPKNAAMDCSKFEAVFGRGVAHSDMDVRLSVSEIIKNSHRRKNPAMALRR